MNEWISVNDRLPEFKGLSGNRQLVIVHWKDTGAVFQLWYGEGHRQSICFYDENEFDMDAEGNDISDPDVNPYIYETRMYSNITHWMPLPPPPKD